MFAYEFEGTRYDAGDKLGYLKAIIAYAMRHPVLSGPIKRHISEIASSL